MTNLLVVGGVVYFGGRFPNVIYGLHVADGSPIWMHSFPARYGAFDDCPLATDGSRVFGMYATPLANSKGAMTLAGVPARQHVYALDARSGRVRWDAALAVTGSEPAYNESAIPMYAGGMLYDGSPIAPVVTALDAATGRVKWSVRVSGPVKGGLVVRDGVLYFGDLKGTLWAVDAASGRAIGSIQTDVSFNVGSPIVLNDSLVIGSAQGPVLAVPLADIRASRATAAITTAPRNILTLLLLTAALLALIGLQTLWRARRMPRSR
jgi:outer membrane protein assembly factor BamB